MSYTQAPATRLLATHCCVCSRPLLDAVSVNLGIGPECRKKYMGKHTDDTREQANRVVRLCAILSLRAQGDDIKRLLRLTKILKTDLGYEKLGEKIEKNFIKQFPVRITEVSGRLHIHTPFNEVANYFWRRNNVPFDRELKVRVLNNTVRDKQFAHDILKKCFAGMTAIGPKGPFVI